MITAVDTNVLLDLLLPDEQFAAPSTQAIEDLAAAGSLVICDIVYAELCVHFRTQRECDETGIRVESLGRHASFLASRVWRTYRRQGGKRSRIPADFLIGSRAQLQATRLPSRDRGFYRLLFPSLALVDPTETRPKL